MKQKRTVLLIVSILIMLLPSLSVGNPTAEDLDPLVDLELTVDILKLRSFEKEDPQVNAEEVIDRNGNPDFYFKIIIDGHAYTSDIFWNTKYIYQPDPIYRISHNIPDDKESISVKIQLWDAADKQSEQDRLCDISADEGTQDDSYDVELTYNVKNGHWTGDDQVKDPSGYGRLNGCDDGTIYETDRDCELWFTIYQNDYDNDHIPYWTETNLYGTDPQVDDSETDFDNDNIPTWWEWKYDYDPFQYEDHKHIDDDNDGIDNNEEYLTSQWYSDPFTRDLFMELDQMEDGPNGETSTLPEKSKELLRTAYNRQNVVYHLDDGSWGEQSGSDLIPFDDMTDGSWSNSELTQIYEQYYNQYGQDTWRRGVFHYGLVIYQSSWVNGNMFGPNRFQISAKGMEEKYQSYGWLDRDVVYASAYMHECGHTLGFRPIPGHNLNSYYPWQPMWWLTRLYKSCMNYGYMYTVVDYSDGSRPYIGRQFGDYDDWERMDLTYFQNEW